MYNEQFDYTSGATTYCKVRPLDEATWSNGIVACTENGATGEYLTDDLLDDAKYVICKQADELNPAQTDERIGRIDPTSAQVVEIDAKIGTPSGGALTDLSQGQAVISAKIDGVETLIGVPVVSVSADIAALQLDVDGIDNSDVLAVLGTPITTIAGDIASVGASADEILYVPRANTQQNRGGNVRWVMSMFSNENDVTVQYIGV